MKRRKSMSKKVIIAILLAVVVASGLILVPALLGNKNCEHIYDNACDASCNECGEEREVTHDYADAGCLSPKTCKVCGTTSGSALGHTWTEATCTAPKTCSVCHATEGSALGHSPNADDGDCTTAITCSGCDMVMTPAKPAHTPGDWVVKTAATKTENGVEVKHCTACEVKEIETRAIYATGSLGLKFELDETTNAYTVIGIDTEVFEDTDLVIPAYYNRLPVTAIGNFPFER